MILRLAPLFFLVAVQSVYAYTLPDGTERYDIEDKIWVELDTAIPEYPKAENLIEFSVGPTETNHFYIDGSSIVIGLDGIVRYVLVLKTVGGAKNVSMEAIRCATKEMKLLATGRADGGWEKIPNSSWQPIKNKLVNQFHAILNRDFFCAGGHPPHDSDEARAGLKHGRHLDAPQ